MAQVQISAEQLDRISKLLRGVPGGAQKAVYGAINRGLTTIRAKSAAEISRVYRISSSAAKSSGNMRMNKATESTMSGSITFAGHVIPLITFSVNYNRNGLVTTSVKRHGVNAALKHAYVTNLGHGLGVFERETPVRESSKQLFGPSMAHMMAEESVVDKVTEAAQRTIDNRVEQEITRILNGYGG